MSKPTVSTASVMILGVGSFAHSIGHALADAGADISTYLTRNYGHFPPSLVGPTFSRDAFSSPVPLIKKNSVAVVIPQSIDWALAPWAKDMLKSGVGIFSPTGEAMRIERERDFARKLCADYRIPFPQAYVASNRLEAEKILARHPQPFVIKNPLCSPTSPIHTILCESVEDTRAWLRHVNYAEGVFLQEYLGRAEAGHIALISGGEVYSLVTNQEYKYAFNENQGIVAGAPLGGLIERDENDKYGLARELIHPLLPWLRKVNYHGPIQVTAVKVGEATSRSPSKNKKSETGATPVLRNSWHVIEYNIRIGVTSGPMILRMLKNPVEIVRRTTRDEKLNPQFKSGLNFGCSLTLAGYGYPFTQVRSPHLPLEVEGQFDCDVWWNEVARGADGRLVSTGHRIADVIALAPTLDVAVANAYRNMRKIRVVGSYFRTDVGQSLWPPGVV
ncbi:MAG TPA: phosphoribosylglycinamide synthetase C domain-containing protein [Candidatus Acidoferrales bacterium]|nr:phosphoribosylglycinamide synthetase C domain-containing protein [Candidatus Acidoferrales bacterium]